MTILVSCARNSSKFADAILKMAPDLKVRAIPDIGKREDIEVALAWRAEPGLLASLPNLKLIVSAGAGVDHLLADATLPQVPLVRFVDPDLTARMVEWVVMHVISNARRMAEFRQLQSRAVWKALDTAAAHTVRVGVMGAGVLGKAVLKALQPFGYDLACWSRSGTKVEGVAGFAGRDGLAAFLARTDILVVLLPLTGETRGLLNGKLFRQLSSDGRRSPHLPGPILINAGRGGLQVESDIIEALDAGVLAAASLDVFETEPLPQSSPLWSHPAISITPHVAADTEASVVAAYVLAQVDKLRRGIPLEHVVDRPVGY